MADGEGPAWTRGEVVPFRGADGGAAPSSLWIDDQPWSEADLPQRPWIVRGYLLRGHVTLIAGAGAAGKSMLMLGWAISLALGKPWGRFGGPDLRVPHRSIVYNVEDDQLEQRLRLSAALRQWDAAPVDVADRVVRSGPSQSGMLLLFDAGTGTVQPTPLMAQLRAEIAERKPDVVMLDPLVELHSSGENDNTALRAVVAHFRAIAREFGCAVVLCHHVRKGVMEPGDIDAARGGGSIAGAARVGLTMQTMRPEDATDLGIPDEQRKDFCRVDGGKSNYAAAREAEWFRKQDYPLDNGEFVSALVPWQPPSQHAAGPAVLAEIIAAIERGTQAGEPWSPKLTGYDRSVRTLLRQHGVVGRKAEDATVEAMLADGVREGVWRGKNRTKKDGYRTDKGPPAEWVE